MRSICNRHDNTIVCDECEKAVLERLEKAEARVAKLEAELANRAGCINEAAKVEP